jgi:hypothetical protein
MDMVNAFLCGNNTDISTLTSPVVAYPYRVCYPDNWVGPTKTQYYKEYDALLTTKQYIPYKRQSHFREHLFRLQNCQFVYISDACYRITAECFKNDVRVPFDAFYKLKRGLKQSCLSRYNETIHQLISKHFHCHIPITPEDQYLMNQLFVQLDSCFSASFSPAAFRPLPWLLQRQDIPTKNLASMEKTHGRLDTYVTTGNVPES